MELTDSPGQHVDELLELFRRVGYVSDTEERLAGELTVYRGTFGDGPYSGLPWTLDEERARWFAERLGENAGPVVWRGGPMLSRSAMTDRAGAANV